MACEELFVSLLTVWKIGCYQDSGKDRIFIETVKLDLGRKLTLKVNKYITKPYIVHEDIFNNSYISN